MLYLLSYQPVNDDLKIRRKKTLVNRKNHNFVNKINRLIRFIRRKKAFAEMMPRQEFSEDFVAYERRRRMVFSVGYGFRHKT